MLGDTKVPVGAEGNMRLPEGLIDNINLMIKKESYLYFSIR